MGGTLKRRRVSRGADWTPGAFVTLGKPFVHFAGWSKLFEVYIFEVYTFVGSVVRIPYYFSKVFLLLGCLNMKCRPMS